MSKTGSTSFRLTKMKSTFLGDRRVGNQQINGVGQQPKSDESMMIEEADLSMENPNLVKFVLGHTHLDSNLPSLTPRVIIVGTIITFINSALTQLLILRTVPVLLHPLISILLIFLISKLYTKIIPNLRLKVPFTNNRYLELNGSPFNLKEHGLMLVMVTSGTTPSFGLITELVKEKYFNEPRSVLSSLLSGFSSILMGISLAGLTQSITVEPNAMVWPPALLLVSLIKALHERSYYTGSSRIKFFIVVSVLAFLYQFVPGYFFNYLSSISILCLVSKSSVVMNQLGSGLQGLGLTSLTLDWSMVVSYLPSPLVYPFYASCNLFIGFVLFMWILVPLGYYLNFFDTSNLPIQSFNLFDKFGLPYDITKVIKENKLDLLAYKEYSEVRFTWLFALSYFFAIAAVTATITHVALYNGLEVIDHIRIYLGLGTVDPQSHHLIDKSNGNQSNQNLSRVRTRTYGFLFISSIILALISLELSTSYMYVRWYVIVIAALISLTLVVPIGWVAGTTSHVIKPNVIIELISGVLWPTNGILCMYFKSFGYFPLHVASNYWIDLKLGQYLKLKPVYLLSCKLYGTGITVLVHTFLSYFMLDNFKDMCSQKSRDWSCTFFRGYYNSTLLWGSIGPTKLFNLGSTYHPIIYSILIGFLLPLPTYFLARRYPNSSMLKSIHLPIILSAAGYLPASPSAMYPTWFLIAYVFNYVIYKNYQSWWLRKNLLLSAALDTGSVIATAVIALVLSRYKLEWWGNNFENNCPLANLPLNPTKELLTRMTGI